MDKTTSIGGLLLSMIIIVAQSSANFDIEYRMSKNQVEQSDLLDLIRKLKSIQYQSRQPELEVSIPKESSEKDSYNEMICQCKCGNERMIKPKKSRDVSDFHGIYEIRCPEGQRRDMNGICKTVIF